MQHIAEALAPRNPRTKERNSVLDPRIPRKTQSQTDNIADYLVDKYQSPEFRPVFLKAAWRVSESRIMEIVELSFGPSVRNPRAYFIKSIKGEKAYM